MAGERLSGGDELEIRSPWSGEVVGLVPWAGAGEAAAAVEAAAGAGRSPLPPHARAAILDRTAAIVRGRAPALARLVALEVAKPIRLAELEVERAAQTLAFSAAEARTLSGAGVPLDAAPAGEGRLGFTVRVPVGVVGAVLPFNFPLVLAAHKLGPAVAAGCPVVVKPSRKAPLAVLALADCLFAAGLPRSWLSVVTGPAEEIVEILVTDERVRFISFTGSAEVGWRLLARTRGTRVALELGNTSPLIVCPDADLDSAACAAATGGNYFAGQSCIAVQRLIVHQSVGDEFRELLLRRIAELCFGDPLDPGTDLGPVIDERARDRIKRKIAEALAHGARQLTAATDDDGHLRPTVLDDVEPGMSVWAEEVFGPVLALRAFHDLAEAIELANGTPYGIQAGIYTRDIGTALAAVEGLDFAGVTVNEAANFRVDQMPYGGVKASGNTREGPRYTVRAMTEERLVVLRKLGAAPGLEPATDADGEERR